jgi:hypothetical protein
MPDLFLAPDPTYFVQWCMKGNMYSRQGSAVSASVRGLRIGIFLTEFP